MKTTEQITKEDKTFLLDMSRKALYDFFRLKSPGDIIDELKNVPAGLKQNGATFVTFTKNGELRGCIGKLQAMQPIYIDIIENTYSAAFDDYRFLKLTEEELSEIRIEISILTPMQGFNYTDNEQLKNMLTEKKPGLYITNGLNSATFLPQVWDDLTNVDDFLEELCLKAGLGAEFWQNNHLETFIYGVIKFSE